MGAHQPELTTVTYKSNAAMSTSASLTGVQCRRLRRSPGCGWGLFVAGWRRYVADDLAGVGELQTDRHELMDCGAILPQAGRCWSSSVAETRAVRPQEARYEEFEAVAVGQHGGDRDLAWLSPGEMQGADGHQGRELRFRPSPWMDYPGLQRRVRRRFARQAHGISLSPHELRPPERGLALDRDKSVGSYRADQGRGPVLVTISVAGWPGCLPLGAAPGRSADGAGGLQ